MSTSGEPGDDLVRAVVLARHRSTMRAAESEVHLIPLPLRSDDGQREVISALCGTRLRTSRIEAVTPGHSLWCTSCFVAHVTGGPAATPAPIPDTTGTVAGRLAVGVAYQRLGWPVTVQHHEVLLDLDVDVDAVALAIPAALATDVADILIRRRCPPPVLAHPAMPTHRVFLAGERYPVPLSWPTGVHRVTGTLLLPPTVTAWGPVCWVRPPVPDALRLCREIDVAAALRTALGTPPPPITP
jgi:hypothetical protein